MEEADKLLWSVQVDHQLFALEKLDVTVSGKPGGKEHSNLLHTEKQDFSEAILTSQLTLNLYLKAL